jgi:hypothetical protein
MPEKETQGQEMLFYDDQYDALNRCIISSGKPQKEIACIVFPGLPVDNAKSRFSRALSPENQECKLSIDGLVAILDNTEPEHFVNFLCDRYGYLRPQKKRELTAKEKLQLIENRIKEKGLDVLFKDVL